GPAIRAACTHFVVLCRQLNLFTRSVVAVDGSKFKAVNTRDKNFTVAKLAKRIEQVEASIERYLSALDHADRQHDDLSEAKTTRIKEQIEGLRRQMQSLKAMERQVEEAPDGTGVLPYVPKTHTSGNAKRGLFTVQDFIYDAENDRYTCPAGEFLTRGKVRSDRRGDMDHYRNLTACLTCGLKPQCTPDKLKRQKRWEHEAVLDRMQARLDRMPEAMTIRRQTVEHPFGTLKAWMGSTHFLTKTLEKVKTEMSLHVLAYNIKRI